MAAVWPASFLIHNMSRMTRSLRNTVAKYLSRSLVLCCLLATVGSPVHAQVRGSQLPVGTRVRIIGVAPDHRLTGNVLRISPDSLAISSGGGNVLLQLPISSISSLEISQGRDRLGWGMKGAGIGALVGAFTGAAILKQSDGGVGALAGFFAGSVLGTAGGAIVGVIVAPERWQWVPVPGWLR